MCDDSRAQRIATTWSGPCLAAAIGFASSGALAAMPAVTAGPQPSRLILIQQSTPGQEPAETSSEPASDQTASDSFLELHEALAAARERLEELSRAAEAVAASGELQQKLTAAQQENQQLRAQIDALRTERDQLNQAKEAAEQRAAEASRTAEQATTAAQEIDQELVAVRWQNAQLNTSFAQAQAQRDQIAAVVDEKQSALQKRIEELEAGTAAATAEAVRLRAQLDEKAQQVGAGADVEQELAEGRDRVATVETEMAALKEQLASAERERAQAVERLTALEGERDGMSGQLADATERLEQLQATNSELENQVDKLREAADSATDMARQNLIAVENRIRELNATLEAIRPAGGPFEPDLSVSDRPGELSANEEAEADGRDASATAVANLAAAPPGSDDAEPVTEAASSETDVDRVKSGSAAIQLSDDDVALMMANLPLEKRLHVQSLLADLDGKIDQRGVTTTVPGGLLFAVNSESVQESAHDTLAKVAELISVYDDRKVLIVGHTDALGDAAYNKQLSERRAELVKQFLVDNFDVDEDRLATQGLGEERPIASDATREGRRANRRVDVLILN